METLAKRLSCYVIAPPDAEISPLLEAFRTRGFEPFFISDFLRRGERRPSQIRTAFRSVNFVVALLYAHRSVNNVLFEIGVAVGLNKPVFIFSDGQFGLPSDLDSIQIQIVDLNNHREIAEHVAASMSADEVAKADQIDYERPPARAAFDTKASRRADRNKLQHAIQNIRGAENQLTGHQLETRLTDAFSGAGLTVVRASHKKPRAAELPDLALWVDDVQKEIGNPIAIEIKRQLGPNNLRDAIEQLAASLTTVGASAGIVLHTNYDLVLADHLQQASPPIYVFSVSELLDLLEENRLGKALKTPRRAFG